MTEPLNIGKFLVANGAKPKPSTSPMFWRDPYAHTLAYKSPLSGKPIDSREARKAEMKEFNCREIEPGEKCHRDGSPSYTNREFMRKHGLRNRGE